MSARQQALIDRPVGEELPAGLRGPLRFFSEDPASWWPWLVALGLLLLAWWWLRRRRAAHETAPAPTPAPRPRGPGFEPETPLAALRRRILESGAWREGCHQLAAFVREVVEPRAGCPLVGRTVPEIRRRLGDVPLVAVLELLADFQFRRREPERSDFEAAADLAEALVRSGVGAVGGPVGTSAGRGAR